MRSPIHCTLLILLALSAAAPLAAYEGVTWLRQPVAARSAGMGGAFSTITGQAEALWTNPAGLASLPAPQALFTHFAWIAGLTTDQACMALPLSGTTALGLAFTRNAASDTYRDAQGNEGASFDISENTVSLAWAGDMGVWAWGVGGKLVQQNVEADSGYGFMADVGLVYTLPDSRFRVAVAAQNLGFAPRAGNGPDVSAPITLRGGVSEEMDEHLRAVQEYRLGMDGSSGSVLLGAEGTAHLSSALGALRAGYDLGQASLGGDTGLTLGGGLRYRGLQFDYAWSPVNALGAGHRISLTYWFD